MNRVFEGRIIFPTSIEYGQIVIDGDTISNIILDREKFQSADIKIEESSYIAAGFIDLQINGAFGKEFRCDSDSVGYIAERISQFGITSFYPTVTTSPMEFYHEHIDKLIDSYKAGGKSRFAGFHFEGPILNPIKKGAHDISMLKSPDQIDFDTFINPYLKIVTLAPELPHAKELITKLIAAGVKIGVGHSAIKHNEIGDIFDEQNMMVIHTFNAMNGIVARDPGLAGTALTEDRYYVNIIADGVHLHPKTVDLIWRCKRDKSKVISISDGSAVMGLENGTYQIGERAIIKSDRVATLEDGTITGAVITVDKAVKNLIEFCNATLCEAINTITLNPATYMGREDKIGQIKIGNLADFAIIDSSYNVEQTYVGGELTFKK